MTIATPSELARWMGHPGFSDAELARAELLLELAEAVIEGPEAAGQSLAESVDTVLLDGTGTPRLLLPRWPVSAVTSVEVDDGSTVTTLVVNDDYTWSEAGILRRRGAVWPCRDRCIEAVYTAGYDPVPVSVKRIQMRLAATTWDNPIGADSEQLGDRNVKWHVPGMELTKSEQRTLAAFGSRS